MAIDVRGLAPLLSVFDMPTSIKFYCEGLGFELATSDGKPAPHFHWVLLRLNGTELMLNTAYDEDQRPQAPDPARTGAHQDTVIYFGCPDVDGGLRPPAGKGDKRKGTQGRVVWHEAVVSHRSGWLPSLLSRAGRRPGECPMTGRSPRTSAHAHL
jgi:glyoxylase I family protein